jgi:SAM-dependent methyltransferase
VSRLPLHRRLDQWEAVLEHQRETAPVDTAGIAGGNLTFPSRCLQSDIHTCRFVYVKSASSLYRLLGDETRLRLLRTLSLERMNVSELTAVLGIAQSGVSRHLGFLKDAGLVTEERIAGFSYYSFSPPAEEDGGPLRQLLSGQFAAASGDSAVRADEARLQEVLRLRRENFETHGEATGQMVPGRSWAAWARALGYLLPPLDVADLGCGEGYLTIEAARWARHVVAIDRSTAVLERARDLARRRGVSNITWKRGEIEKPPIDDESVDVAMLSQALHHARRPEQALEQAARIVVPGGRVLVLDLRRHDQEWVQSRLGDLWLGFTDDELADLLTGAGFEKVDVRVGSRRAGGPFVVLIASAVKPGVPPGLRRRLEKLEEHR